nr:EAL domain-containing protein [Actibacterium sp. 188UL27-1]
MQNLNWVLTCIVLGLIGLGNFALAVHFDLFEWFFEFSRNHQSWELDELFLLAINLIPLLIIGLILRTWQLKKVVRRHLEAETKAQHLALHDPLTGLGNRLAFLSHLKSLTRETPDAAENDLTTLLIDLDRFKPINDLYGHAAGDNVLITVAQRIASQIGADDFMVRLGGDEFAVVLDHRSGTQRAEALARAIIDAIAEPIEIEGLKVRVGVSVGIASNPANRSFSANLAQTDLALHAAKRSGRNGFTWYNNALEEQAREAAILESDLHTAIDNGEITPHFQPIVNIETGLIEGFEVLARWIHPERGLIPPTVFIPVAETAGMIEHLSGAVLKQACGSACDWDPRFMLSVNISPREVHDTVLVEMIRRVISETGFDATRLQIEITENAVISDFKLARNVILDLQALDISVALDDFGTGFSSLSSLRDLPFDRIKIDRSFVTNISMMPSNRKIVAGIMSLARELELPVTAEGVETPEDLSFLRALGCGSGQGFLFERALPASDIAWLLETKWSNKHVPEAVMQPIVMASRRALV